MCMNWCKIYAKQDGRKNMEYCLLKTQFVQQYLSMFSKAEKNLNEINNFNPPPGHYSKESTFDNTNANSLVPSFARQERFGEGQTYNPGPGHYYNDRIQKIKKRLIDESRKRDQVQKPGGQSEIKISSIPSIPKKSATRVYEELAPGILILHQQENESSNIGPGSYNINPNVNHKKAVSHKINPEHKKKRQVPEPQIKIPTIAEQIRNQKRLLYKKNLIKSTGANKALISPSDLCLEVIILRERMMRSDDNPPPGCYYNQKYQSSFKEADPDLLPQYQLMMGKEQRFKDLDTSAEAGPGAYQSATAAKNAGGFIPKEERKIHSDKKNIPGPGSYKIQYIKPDEIEAKGNYPPIFGSGCNRFYSAQKRIQSTPGPGSYKLDNPKKKKQKVIKVKKNFYESQVVKPQEQDENNQELFSMGGDKSRFHEHSLYNTRDKKGKNNHYFSSKVDRFTHVDKNGVVVGPGNYNTADSAFSNNSFNKRRDYTGSKQPRFDDNRVRPNLGPGTYFGEGTLKKQ